MESINLGGLVGGNVGGGSLDGVCFLGKAEGSTQCSRSL